MNASQLSSAVAALAGFALLAACGGRTARDHGAAGSPDDSGGYAGSGATSPGGAAGAAGASAAASPGGEAGTTGAGGVMSCAEIEAAYADAAEAARRCVPGSTAPDCTTLINVGLFCGFPMVANGANTLALAELDRLFAAYRAAGCAPEVPCVAPPDVSVVTEGPTCSAEGTCLSIGNRYGSGYCLDVEPSAPAASFTLCNDDDDCASSGTRCLAANGDPCFGLLPMRSCVVDEDCSLGAVCVESACGGTMCSIACPEAPCADTADCLDGRCVEKACDAAGAAPCADLFSCSPGESGADTRGCVPLQCISSANCPLGWVCAPGSDAGVHGCRGADCTRDRDCACGSCVSGRCAVSPGFCVADWF
ncbi:MAG: hypothetical protein JW751_11075 [Polyangiaceae bacterium]|nr:hypothetical protein [Polyangiaceae bacterium]